MVHEGGSHDEVRLKRRRFAFAIVAAGVILFAIRLAERGGGCNNPSGPALQLPPDPELPGWWGGKR